MNIASNGVHRKKTAIVFGNNYWESPYQVGSHFFAQELASDGWSVLYLSDPLGLPHRLAKIMGKGDKARWQGTELHQVAPSLWAWVPYVWITCARNFLQDSLFLAKNWYRFPNKILERKIEHAGFGNPDLIFINSLHYAWANETFSSAKSVFRIADWNPSMAGLPRSLVKVQKELVDKVDVVFVSSQAVIHDFLSNETDRKPHYLPNGFSLDGLRKDAERPVEYKQLSGNKKIAVYVGAIDQRFDFALVEKCAAEIPSMNIFVIGKDDIGAQYKNAAQNLFFLGPRPFSEISGYLAHADLAFMPQTRSYAATDYFNPLKLYQYMFFDLPVISTWWKELDFLAPPVLIARSDLEFIRYVHSALGDGLTRADEYKAFLSGRTWKDIYQNMMAIISSKEQ